MTEQLDRRDAVVEASGSWVQAASRSAMPRCYPTSDQLNRGASTGRSGTR